MSSDTSTREWNYADVWETIAEAIPEAVAQVGRDVRAARAGR